VVYPEFGVCFFEVMKLACYRACDSWHWGWRRRGYRSRVRGGVRGGVRGRVRSGVGGRVSGRVGGGLWCRVGGRCGGNWSAGVRGMRRGTTGRAPVRIGVATAAPVG
jgi:hypothetical protein